MKVPAPWEENLRRFVIMMGRGLERLIDKAKTIRSSRHLPKVEAVLSLEGQLPLFKIRELVQFASLRLLGELTPPLIDKSVLAMGEGVAVLTPLCRDKGASTLLEVELGSAESPLADGEESLRVQCRPQKLAVRNGNFDAVVALLSSPIQGELDPVMQELSRVLVMGGDVLITDFHPFGLYAKRGSQRLRASFVRGIEDYYRLARLAGIELSDCREGFCDEKAAAFFVTPEEKQIYRRIKDSPLVIAFRGRKMGGVK